jgi:hypothetical protein
VLEHAASGQIRINSPTIRKGWKSKGLDFVSIAQKHRQIGYALYMGGHPLSTCQNAMQIAGWLSAKHGELAAADCDTAAYLVRNGSWA